MSVGGWFGQRQQIVEIVDLLLLQAIDLIDVGLHDLLQARFVETVQAVIGNRFESAPHLVG